MANLVSFVDDAVPILSIIGTVSSEIKAIKLVQQASYSCIKSCMQQTGTR